MKAILVATKLLEKRKILCKEAKTFDDLRDLIRESYQKGADLVTVYFDV